MKTEKIDWKESTCPICGKKFIPAPEHVYRRRVRTSLRYICSYHCVLEYDRLKKRLKSGRKRKVPISKGIWKSLYGKKEGE